MIKKGPLKVIIAGSRSIHKYALVKKAILASGFNIGEVVCGMAPGVDLLGKRWGDENGIPVKEMPAAWRVNGRYNPNAGFERNEEMGDYADAAVIVYDGESSGSAHMMKYMRKIKKPCYVFRIDFVDLFDLMQDKKANAVNRIGL